MANRVHVITQDDWDDELTMANPSTAVSPAKTVISPPKKFVQLNFFGEVVPETPKKASKTTKTKADNDDTPSDNATTNQVSVSTPKTSKKTAKKGVKKGYKIECKATRKLAAKLHVEDYFKWRETWVKKY